MARYMSTPEEEFIATHKYPDLQKACIVRGIDFDELVQGTYFLLSSWLRKNWYNPIKLEKLAEFDEWRLKIMKSFGREDEPFIRFAHIPENLEEVIANKTLKVKEKSDKPKRVLDEDLGVMGGTKKHLTYNCQKTGKTVQETIDIVKLKFPDAQDKSISIWWKRSRKANSE